jgi:hypothetical protein
VVSLARGVYEFVHEIDIELSNVGFEGGETVAEIGCGAVKGCAAEDTHRGDGGAERHADLALEGIEMGVTEKAELEGKVFADEVSSKGAEIGGLCERGGGWGIDDGCDRAP